MKINIEDINYVDSHEELNRIPKIDTDPPTVKKAWSIFSGMLVTKGSKVNKQPCVGRYLFVAPTNNNVRSLQPVQEQLNDSVLLRRRELHSNRVYFHACLNAPKVLYKIMTSKGFIRKSYIRNFIRYCLSYGYFYEACRILRNFKPEMLVLANDHAPIPRAYMRAAQMNKIRTAYLQHASVTEFFPPLEVDYAFLDGEESLEKYTRLHDCHSTVFLSGASRFDIFTEQRQEYSSSGGCKIGIAFNPVDVEEKVIDFVRMLAVCPELEITLRPHPTMQQDKWTGYAQALNCRFSDSTKENPLHFISQHDVFISGLSSFHLDVAASSKRSFCYNFTDGQPTDYYGYIRTGLITDISGYTHEQIILLLLSSAQPCRNQVTGYYLANYNTPFWGKASQLIAETLRQIIEENRITDIWSEYVENGNFKKYTLGDCTNISENI